MGKKTFLVGKCHGCYSTFWFHHPKDDQIMSGQWCLRWSKLTLLNAHPIILTLLIRSNSKSSSENNSQRYSTFVETISFSVVIFEYVSFYCTKDTTIIEHLQAHSNHNFFWCSFYVAAIKILPDCFFNYNFCTGKKQ